MTYGTSSTFSTKLLLTKQPQNLIKFSPFPDNCWVGVTATNREMWLDAVWELQDVKAKVKYLSIEPFLSWIHSEKEPNDHLSYTADWLKRSDIGWIIIGAQTKPTVYPKIEWVKEIVEAADNVNIPVFLKDNLKPILPEESPFYDVIDEDSYLTPRLRQEIPIA